MKRTLTRLAVVASVALVLTGCAPTGAEAESTYTPPPPPVVTEAPETAESTEAPVRTTTVPDVVGLDGSEAFDVLFTAGLEVEWSEDVWIKSNWNVDATSPAAGEVAPFGSTVFVTVSKPEYVPEPKVQTTGGLESWYAWDYCEQHGQNLYPYGFTLHYILGQLAEEYDAANDQWYLKAEATVTNEYGEDMYANAECYITGSNERAVINNFLVY